MIRPRGTPPTPSAMSRPIEPVETTSTGTRALSSPSFMMAPFPNCFSICCSARSSALIFSLAVGLLEIMFRVSFAGAFRSRGDRTRLLAAAVGRARGGDARGPTPAASYTRGRESGSAWAGRAHFDAWQRLQSDIAILGLKADRVGPGTERPAQEA